MKTKKQLLRELLERELQMLDSVDEDKVYKRIAELIRALSKINAMPSS